MSDDFCTAVLHDHVYPTQAGRPGLVGVRHRFVRILRPPLLKLGSLGGSLAALWYDTTA
jgi:hypothetical protein